MPMDKQGKYQMNDQKVRHSNAMHQPAIASKSETVHSTTYDHGDGTGHTEMADGTRHEHPDMEAHKSKMDAAMMDDQEMDGDCAGKPMPAKAHGKDDSWD